MHSATKTCSAGAGADAYNPARREHDWAGVHGGCGINSQGDTYRQGVQEGGIGVSEDARKPAPQCEAKRLSRSNGEASLPQAIVCQMQEIADVMEERGQLVL